MARIDKITSPGSKNFQSYRFHYRYGSRPQGKSQSYQASIQCWVSISSPANRLEYPHWRNFLDLHMQTTECILICTLLWAQYYSSVKWYSSGVWCLYKRGRCFQKLLLLLKFSCINKTGHFVKETDTLYCCMNYLFVRLTQKYSPKHDKMYRFGIANNACIEIRIVEDIFFPLKQ